MNGHQQIQINNGCLANDILSGEHDSLYEMAMKIYNDDSVNMPGWQSPAPASSHICNEANDSNVPPAFHRIDEFKELDAYFSETMPLSPSLMNGNGDGRGASDSNAPVHQPGMISQSLSYSSISNLRVLFEGDVDMENTVALLNPSLPVRDMENIVALPNPSLPLPSDTTNPRKRPMEFDASESSRSDIHCDQDSYDDHFLPCQNRQWKDKYDALCAYRETKGDCDVPHTYPDSPSLARWVKRQRYQYKLMKEGKSSTMTEDRMRSLEQIGFVWNSQHMAWCKRLKELEGFRQLFGHSNVPTTYRPNQRLATWVKCQRRHFKLFNQGKPSNMTPERINDLNKIGFVWFAPRIYQRR